MSKASDKSLQEIRELVNDGDEFASDPPTDAQQINATFWDKMADASIGFDDRVTVLECLRDALNEHCGTLYIP
jgi:hypothetical protein